MSSVVLYAILYENGIGKLVPAVFTICAVRANCSYLICLP